MRTRLSLAGTLATAILLAACGGGGDSGPAPTTTTTTTTTPTTTTTTTTTPTTTTTTPTTTTPATTTTTTTTTANVQVLDSFGRVVASTGGGGDGGSGVGVGDSGADGTAGDGAPIANGTVTITDVNGKSVTATTNAEGYYRAKITGFVAPFTVKVVAGTKTRYSLNVQPSKTNAFVTININPLTQKIASDVATAAKVAGPAQLTPAAVASNSSVVTTSIAELRTTLSTGITNAGLTPATFDPLTVPFKADHTGYDKVLDTTVVNYDANGKVVTLTPTIGLAGTWQSTFHVDSITVDGQTVTTGINDVVTQGVIGAQVPGTQAEAQARASSNSFNDGAGTSGTMTCDGTGNCTLTAVSNGTTVTAQLKVVLQSYSGCGSCGVGSTVVLKEQISTTISTSGITSNSVGQYTITFKRIS